MSDGPDNLILIQLRRLAAGQDSIRDDLRELKSRVTSLETQVGQLIANEQIHYAATMARFDKAETRLDRIERRLDLVDTSAGP